MSDPDFIESIQAGRLEDNVSKRSSKTPSQPTINRINITLRFEDESTLTISRSRLDNDFVQSAINRVTAKKNAATKQNIASTSHLASANTKEKDKRLSQPQTQIFSHLHQLDSNSIITPEQIKTLCQANVIYHVISRPVIKINDGGVLSLKQQRGGTRITHSECHYDGSVLFVIRNVPTTSQNGVYQVSEKDVHRWIVHGAISNTETVDILASKVDAVKQSLILVQQELDRRNENNNAPLRSGRGRLTSHNIRERKSASLLDEKKRLETLLQTTTNSLNALYAQHVKKCILYIQKTSKGKTFPNNNKTCDWTVQVISGDEENDKTYTDLIEKKKNWSSVPLYAFGDCNSSDVSLTIPDEEKSDRFVDTGGVTMTKLPHGFGIYERYDEVLMGGSGKTKSSHRLYHGHFYEGQFSEGTLYTAAGVYTGKFDLSGQPTVGVMEYADGIKVSGQFASSESKSNPYCHGVPHGDVHIKFPDKTTFQGHMIDGVISGEGVYMQEGVQLRGNFEDGVLQDEEKRDQNLNMSLMLGGERLWYPTPTRR